MTLSTDFTKQFIMHAHGDQRRRHAHIMYYTHPMNVSEIATDILKLLPYCFETHKYTVETVALLHDTVEDSYVTLELLSDMGYSDAVVRAVDLLTKKQKDTHRSSVNKILNSDNYIAKIVKAADAFHNSLHTEHDVQWCISQGRDHFKESQKYTKSYTTLLNDISNNADDIIKLLVNKYGY